MKLTDCNLSGILAAIFNVLILASCGGGGSDGGGTGISCSDIAGNYAGTLTVQFAGQTQTTSSSLWVKSDCTFDNESGGTFTSKDGNVYTGSGKTNDEVCNTYTMSCIMDGSSAHCNMNYSDCSATAIFVGNKQ